MIIIGIDISLNATGFCVINESAEVLYKSSMKKICSKIKAHDKYQKFIKTKREFLKILDMFEDEEDIRVIFEEYIYPNPKNAKQLANIIDVVEIHGLIRSSVIQFIGTFFTLAPTTLKKLITGNSQAPKDLIAKNIRFKFGLSFEDDNIADAFAAAMALRNMIVRGDNEDIIKTIQQNIAAKNKRRISKAKATREKNKVKKSKEKLEF